METFEKCRVIPNEISCGHILLWLLYRAVFEILTSHFVWPQIHCVATGCKYGPRQSETYVELINNHECLQGRESKLVLIIK